MSPWPGGKNKEPQFEVSEFLDPKAENSKVPVAPVKAAEPETSPAKESSTIVIKTEIDSYINYLLKGQAQKLEDIKVTDVPDPLRGTHALILPKEVSDVFKKKNLAVRWIYKKKQAIDHATHDRGWTIANKVYFPELSAKGYLFTANGTIETGDLILGFMPEERAERLRRIPGEISSEKVKNLPMEKWKQDQNGSERIGYYKPALTAEKDGALVKEGLQPDLPSETD